MSNQNAHIGLSAEKLFKNTIGSHPEVLRALADHFSIDASFAKAFKTGTDAGKSDVLLRFGNVRTLSANIKAFSAGFNQLTRTTIASFCREFDLGHLRQLLEQGAIRKAGRAGRFITEEDESLIIENLSPLAPRIVQYALARSEQPELLALFDRNSSTMYLYDMEVILNELEYEVSITRMGIIRLGRFVTIQRKGGNGVKFLHVPKTSLEHPGNNLQIKMKVKAFVQEVQPIVKYIP